MPGMKNTLYWVVPTTLLGVTAFAKSRPSAVASQPLLFVPSGKAEFDSGNLERIRQDWKIRNKGLGLRDVSRSGGGV
ncbi:uncharacterized protein BYT42DRAFT_614313 [Radiomyces spectabilis]|uniref:uncharacterized protein n=1 Tax=Radiomyces spectabilis TaxID=64574 RepID=UPI002220BAF8|nr:uncharacterized protein BYT42DRAFT_614313 [Radiomyces spectabilis]KAI8377648.1 hypothetical protein BYT42DRAFT_614313 [Radiomyces spectabilis]